MTDANIRTGDSDLLPRTASSDHHSSPGFSSNRALWKSAGLPTFGRGAKQMRFAFVLLTTLVIVCGISGWIGWATTAIEPLNRPRIALVGTDYHDNFLIPSGLYGDRALGKFAALCTEESAGNPLNLRLTSAPIDFLGIQSIDNAFEGVQTQPFLLYLSAHGVSSPTGPLLLPRNASTLAEGVYLREILKRFRALPAQSPKALVLDACGIATDHRWGILHNDFSFQVRSLNEEISEIENLVVILDSDTDQQAWNNPSTGTTVFGDAFIESVRGSICDNDHDGWMDLYDSYVACKQDVETWVANHTAFSQSPVLLPEGDEGKKRASRITLRATASEPLPEPASLTSSTRSDLIDSWWTTYEQFNARTPHPAISTPLLWDRFVAAILRFEHFELSGSRAAADWINDQLQLMNNQLEHGRPIESSAARAGLVSPLSVGMIPSATMQADATSVAEHLLASASDARGDAWRKAISNISNPYSLAHFRRQVVACMIDRVCAGLQASTSIDRKILSDTALAIDSTLDPLQPDSTLTTAYELLSRDLPTDFNTVSDAKQLARLLNLWGRCDRVTSASSSNFLHLEPQILPWVQSLLQDADTQRRLAFDLIMGDAESRLRSDDYLARAERLYSQIDDMASVVTSAETRLRVGWNQLAWIAATIESRGRIDVGLKETEAMVRKLELAYDAAAQLDAALGLPRDVKLDDTAKTCNILRSLDAQFDQALQALSGTLGQWHQQDLNSDQLPEVLCAISLPGGTGPERRTAWQKCQQLAAKPLDQDSQNDESLDVAQAASLLGRLALASWTPSDFDRLAPNKPETYVQVRHHLDIFSVELEWRNVLCEIGFQIASRYENARSALGSTPTNDFTIEARNSLARRFDSLLPREAADTIDRCRQAALANYLITAARRGIADCLASVDQQAMPQYARLAAVLIDDASRYSNSSEIEELHQSVAAANSLNLQVQPQIDWTTEKQYSVQIDLMRQQDANPGFVTITATADAPIKLLHPTPGERICRPIRTMARSSDPVAPAMIDTTLLQLDVDRDELKQIGHDSADIGINGYFRGRQVSSNIAVNFHLLATQHYVSGPVSKSPQVAVRSPLANHTNHYRGSIAIVLDCSGSMGSVQGQTFDDSTKYAQAVQAVEQIVKELPAGTRLSVWTFGQAGSPTKTVNPPEQTIRRVLSPMIWDPSDQKRISNLVSKLSYPACEPWNESPLIASLIAASKDFTNQDDVFRSVLVVTDGFDNRIEADSANNPGRSTAADVIRQTFANTGVALNVIGFRVEPHETKSTADSMAVVRDLLPPGKYVQVDQAENLVNAIRNCLAAEVKYEIRRLVDKDSQPLIRFSESPATGAIRWSEGDLEPGTYELRGVLAGRSPQPIATTIVLNPGDRMLLRRTPDNRLDVADSISNLGLQGERRTTETFNLLYFPVVSKQLDTISRQLFVEHASAGPLAINPPLDVWLKAGDVGAEVPCRWYRQTNQPGCTYKIDILNQLDRTVDVPVRMYMTDHHFVPIGRLLRNRDFKHFQDLAPATWQDSAGVVSLTDAKIEQWQVPDETGNLATQSCLVLRLKLPEKSAFRLRTRGLKIGGFDEQYFAAANAYTFRVWPITDSEVERNLQSIELFSVNQIMESAVRSGSMFQFQSPSASSGNADLDAVLPVQKL